jgi:hypothetical protein
MEKRILTLLSSRKQLHHRFLLLLLGCVLLNGCQKNETPEKVKDLDFTIVAGTDIPDELQELIDARSADAFELTYSDGSFLYIVKGYGAQQTSGYSITVNDFYQAEESLVFETKLVGPSKDDEVSNTQTYPYIVIKTKNMEESVLFETE